jgi:hypothetical protein
MKLLNHKFKWPATAVFYGSLLIGIYSLSFENQLDEIWKLPVYSLVGNESGFLGTGLGKKGWTETALFNELRPCFGSQFLLLRFCLPLRTNRILICAVDHVQPHFPSEII